MGIINLKIIQHVDIGWNRSSYHGRFGIWIRIRNSCWSRRRSWSISWRPLGGNRGGGWGGNNWNNGGVGSPAVAAVATDLLLNPAFQSIQHQINELGDQIGTNTVLEAVRHIDDQVASYNTNTQNLIGNVATAQATSAFTTLQSINDLGRDITAQANQNVLQQLNSFNQLTTATLQGFNGTAMQMQNSTNQIISQGTANAAAVAAGFCDISRELATCCCELKQRIVDDGNLTRALINDTNVQNLRDQLAAANGKVSNNEQNQILIDALRNCNRPVCSVI